MNKLKQLTEKHAELFAQAEKLDTTKPEERAKATELLAQVKEIDAAIKTEVEVQNIKSRAAPDLSKQERRDIEGFHFGRLLRHLHSTLLGRPSHLDGVEAEILSQGDTEAREAGISPHGVMLPSFIVRKRAIEARALSSTGPGSEGGLTIATEKRGLLDDFFASSAIVQAGATVLTGLVGNVDLPRIHASTAKPTGKKEFEDSNAITPTFAQLKMAPKRLPAHIPNISESLFMQSSEAIEAVLRGHVTNELGVVQEAAFFHGTGVDEAEGVLATAGIGSVSGGDNGAEPTWDRIVDLEDAIDTQNALLGSLHYITNGRVRSKLKKSKYVDNFPRFLLDPGTSELNGYTTLFTNAIRKDLKKGTATNCSALFFGNWADYAIGLWSGVALELLRGPAEAIKGTYTLVGSTYYDGGVMRPKSFAAMADILTA